MDLMAEGKIKRVQSKIINLFGCGSSALGAYDGEIDDQGKFGYNFFKVIIRFTE
jgi:hypothetical protein